MILQSIELHEGYQTEYQRLETILSLIFDMSIPVLLYIAKHGLDFSASEKVLGLQATIK